MRFLIKIYLSDPITMVEVKRSFSAYRAILTVKRTSLIRDKLERHLITNIKINKHFKYLLLGRLQITFFKISGYVPKDPVSNIII